MKFTETIKASKIGLPDKSSEPSAKPQPKGKEEIQKMDEKTAIESFAEVMIILLIIGYFYPDTKRRIDEKKKKDEENLD